MNSFGQRLLSARKIAGMTLQQLADKMNIEISKQALSQFEKGQTKPTSKVVISIANALGQPVDYFFMQTEVKIKNLEFRTKIKLTQKEIESIRFQAIAYIEKFCEIERILNIKRPFIKPLKKTKACDDSDVEKRTVEIRQEWSLGFAPIIDVIKLLEEHNIKILEVDAPEGFSGMSLLADDMAIIVLNKNINIVRKRLTALHELAHLIFTFPEDMNEQETERLCLSFAGAFLLPKEKFINELGENRTSLILEELISLENYYGISVQAIMWRALNIGIVSESKFNKYYRWLNKSGNLKVELGSFKGIEKPIKFNRLIYKAMSLNIITNSKAAALLDTPLNEIENDITRIL